MRQETESGAGTTKDVKIEGNMPYAVGKRENSEGKDAPHREPLPVACVNSWVFMSAVDPLNHRKNTPKGQKDGKGCPASGLLREPAQEIRACGVAQNEQPSF